MSVSELWQYTKMIRIIEKSEDYERTVCYKCLLVSVENELWGVTELSDAEKREVEEHQHLAASVVTRVVQGLDDVVRMKWANPGERAKQVARESRHRLRAAIHEWRKQHG